MKIVTSMALLFYIIIITTFSILVILFASNVILLDEVNSFLQLVNSNNSIRLYVIIASLIIIALSLIFAKIIAETKEKGKTIAFDNPAGRVTVSLSAMEDLVKRLMYRFSEVKEVKADVVAGKKGIRITTRLVLKEDVNIPDMTSKLQDIIKSKVQEILGVDETVTVRINIVKIISEQSKLKRSKTDKDDFSETPVPFQGYRS